MKLENIYSQNGEDSILEYIINTLKIKDGTLAEFGAWDGFHLSNVQNLFQNNKNFHVIFIEPNEKRFEELLMKNQHPNICCLKEFVTFEENHLAQLLDGHIHGQLQVLSMDTDVDDFRIWKNNKALRPAIVIIEIQNWKSETYRREVYAEFQKDGYLLAFVTGNFVFVRNDCFKLLGVSYNDPDELFQQCQHVEFCLERGHITVQQFHNFIGRYCHNAQGKWHASHRTWMCEGDIL
jgi:hypothetical protein